MKRKSRIYPIHKCCSCESLTENKTYCDLHLKAWHSNSFLPSANTITANMEVRTLHGRYERSGVV